MTGAASPSIHATAVVIGDFGVLIRGASGAGKSALALDVVDRALASGTQALIVADDRVLLQRRDDRLLARAPAILAGLISIRGTGVVRVPHAGHAEIRLVVDLGPRHEDDRSDIVQLIGITLPRICSASREEALSLIFNQFRLEWRASPRLALARRPLDRKYTHP